jgi:ATP-dependent Lhr-like helicase
VRDDADWMLPHAHKSTLDFARGLSPIAREVLSYLHQRGASFFADIVRGTRKLKSEIESGLWELVAAGIITADGFDNLRALIDPKRRAGQGHGRASRPRHSSGRWSLLYPGAQDSEAHDRAAHSEALEATCRMLLNRYGVVLREVLTRESILPRWREVLLALRRLEDRGEVRGGRFVSGFLGEQFALPVALESLRAARSRQPSGETITVSAADPLNLVGIIVPGDRVPALSGRVVTFRDGIAIDDSRSVLPSAAASS